MTVQELIDLLNNVIDDKSKIVELCWHYGDLNSSEVLDDGDITETVDSVIIGY